MLTDKLAFRYPKGSRQFQKRLEEVLTAHRLKSPGLLWYALPSAYAWMDVIAACLAPLSQAAKRKSERDINKRGFQ